MKVLTMLGGSCILAASKNVLCRQNIGRLVCKQHDRKTFMLVHGEFRVSGFALLCAHFYFNCTCMCVENMQAV